MAFQPSLIWMSARAVKNMNIYSVVTDRIIEAIEQNRCLPWKQPWKSKGRARVPTNLVSRREYRGINVWLLTLVSFQSPYFLTFNQAKKLGGMVCKGQRGTPIVFWSVIKKKNPKTGEAEEIPLLRYSTVFNIEQCEGIETPTFAIENTASIGPIESCEAIISGFKNPPTIIHGENSAYYSISNDLVGLPSRDAFTSLENYYATAFHEISHSTAHPSRLNRKFVSVTSFFSRDYSREELIAELSASFLCRKAGIDPATFDNSASYINDWLEVFRKDKRILIDASSQAQKAADYILGYAHREEDTRFEVTKHQNVTHSEIEV